MAHTLASPMFTIFVTDMRSPDAETPSGKIMRRNMKLLRNLKYSHQALPQQNVSALDIPKHLLQEGNVFLVGSPANHDPCGDRVAGQHGNNISFKQDVFFSMCYHTPEDSVVAMTFSQSACIFFTEEGYKKGLEWWTVTKPGSHRVLMVAPAWFQRYQPSKGLAENNTMLAADPEKPDTMVAIFAPPSWMAKLEWRPEALNKLDLAATVLNWLRHSGKQLVTFGAFTGELEVDIALTAVQKGEFAEFKDKLIKHSAVPR